MGAIEICADAGNDDRETVFRWLREHNHTENGTFMQSLEDGAEKELFLVARHPDGSVVGGLLAVRLHRWLKVNIMAVAPQMRSQGIGSKLLVAAEKIAAGEDCRFSYVDTMSHQAPEFYRAQGYREVGRLPDWDSHGHEKFFFMKELS